LSNLVVSCSFTQSRGSPATGLTLTDIDITLSSINKSTGAVAAIWNTENPTVEISNVGKYARIYASADLDTYAYFATANYTGGTTLDCDDVEGSVGVALDEMADAVWDEAASGHTSAGTMGAQLGTDVDAILTDTNELQGDLTDGGRLDLLIDAIKERTDKLPDDPADDSDIDGQLATIDTVVDAILADTGTDGVVVSTATAQAIADEILKRNAEGVEDAADNNSLAELIYAALNSAISGTTWTIKKPSDDSTFNTRTVTTNAAADPVTGVT